MSIRLLLVLLLIALVTLLNFVAAVRGYLGSMEEAERLFDERLSAQVELIHFSLGQHLRAPGQVVYAAAPLSASSIGIMYSTEFQIWHPQQGVLARSADLPAEPVAALQEGFSEFSYQGYRWRARVHFDESLNLWYMAAERFDQRYRLAEAVIVRAILPLVLIVPVMALCIWLIVSLGLRPLEDFTRRLSQKSARDFSPLPQGELPKELHPLVEAVNALLGRLAQAFSREKRFSADAAHELRTPLAGLKVNSANLLASLDADPNDPAIPKLAQRLQHSADRMGHLVSQILTLNRAAQEDLIDGFVAVDLSAVTKQCLADAFDAIELRALHWDFAGSEAVLMGDAWALEILVGNLVSNAIKYTPEGGQLRLNCQPQGQQIVWELEDSGPGIAPDLRQRVYDRFYRVGGDRHPGGVSGCGLGLSIVAQIVELHAGQIELASSPLGGLLVRLTFKAADTARG